MGVRCFVGVRGVLEGVLGGVLGSRRCFFGGCWVFFWEERGGFGEVFWEVYWVLRVFGVFRCSMWVSGVGCGGSFWVSPDKKNDPKWNMGFDFDTVSKEMLKTAENQSLDKNDAKS